MISPGFRPANTRFLSTAWPLMLLLAACGGPSAPAVTITSLEPEAPPTAPVTRVESGTARAFVARNQKDLPGGPAAAGEPGDLVLRNERLTAVIRAANHRGRVAPTGGNVIDLAPADGPDNLGEAALFLDPDARALARFREVVVAQDGKDGGLAIVRASGTDPRDEQVEVDVDYILESGSDRLRAMTTVTHHGRSHYRDFVIGHWMSWGTLHTFVPGPGGDVEGRRTSSAWVGADSPDAAVLISGLAGLVDAVHGREFSLVAEKHDYLQPGAVLSWETSFYVGRGGGVAEPQSALWASRQTVTGQVHGILREKKHQKPVHGGWIQVVERDGTVATRARTDTQGGFTLDLEPGRYRLVAVAEGRTPTLPVSFDVPADGHVEQVVLVEPAARLHFNVVDGEGHPLPARALLVPHEAAGPEAPGTAAAGPLGPLFAPAGHMTARIAPGEYTLHVGAGPGHGLFSAPVSIRAGETRRVEVRLPAQVDLAGLRAVDPSVHTVHGPTSSVTAAQRRTACAVEGVDVLVATDERAGEPWPARNDTPFEPPLTLRGLEIQTDDARLGALPLVTVPVLPAVLPETAATALPWLRALPGGPLVTVFRPRSRALGYFEHFAFDPAQPALPRGGFTLDFDMLGVLSPGLGAETDRTVADYLGLLRRGQRVIPLGASGSDEIVSEICGMPRTWVMAEVRDAATLVAAFSRGATVASGGPVLRMTADPPGPGRAIHVVVDAPDWLRPSRLDLFFNHEAAVHVELPTGGATAPLHFEHTFPLPPGTEWVVAQVDGPRKIHPLYPGGLRPLAITAPLRFETAPP